MAVGRQTMTKRTELLIWLGIALLLCVAFLLGLSNG